jgi:hypothetical protein
MRKGASHYLAKPFKTGDSAVNSEIVAPPGRQPVRAPILCFVGPDRHRQDLTGRSMPKP